MGILLRRILISLVLPFAWRKWRERRATRKAEPSASRHAGSAVRAR